MSQPDRNSQKENKSRGNEPNFNWRGVILIVIAFAFIGLAMLFYRGGMQPVEEVPYNRFLELLENKQIVNDKNFPLTLIVEEGRATQALSGYHLRRRRRSRGSEGRSAGARRIFARPEKISETRRPHSERGAFSWASWHW